MRGRPLGEVSAALLALADECGAITAPMAAARLQLSAREASRTAGYLRAAGLLVEVTPPPVHAPQAQRGAVRGRPARWLALPRMDLAPGYTLDRWLHD